MEKQFSPTNLKTILAPPLDYHYMLGDDQRNDFFQHDLDDDPYLGHGQTHDQMTDVHT